MNDWVEFYDRNAGKISLRTSWIIAINQIPYNAVGDLSEYTRIVFNAGNGEHIVGIAEPYEQVKQKIMDAEKVDLSDVVAEHFTREEYKYLLNVMIKYGKTPAESPEDSSMYLRIRDKLNEILKEEE